MYMLKEGISFSSKYLDRNTGVVKAKCTCLRGEFPFGLIPGQEGKERHIFCDMCFLDYKFHGFLK